MYFTPSGLVQSVKFPGYGKTPTGDIYFDNGKEWVKQHSICHRDGELVYKLRIGSRIPHGWSMKKASEIH
jgi:hypothetical protein